MTHFDVILPTIGRNSLARAVESVVDQTHRDFTLRIVSDGAYIGHPEPDEDPLGWQAVIDGTDTRYTVMGLENKTPRGDYGAYARNHEVRKEMLVLLSKDFKEHGLEPYNYEDDLDTWVTYIDDDDMWLPSHLETINKIIEENPDVNMVRTAGQSFMMKHKSPRSSKRIAKLGPVNTTDILTVGMAHTRRIFEQTQGWQPCDNHDHLLWAEMLAAGGIAHETDQVTFLFER